MLLMKDDRITVNIKLVRISEEVIIIYFSSFNTDSKFAFMSPI